ncbi:hypothetical protein P5673_001466, partial [Acropora cervicornis]
MKTYIHDDRSSNDLGLRGPPLDENLLLSNIATANKKVKHLSEVGHHIVIKSVT